MANVRDFGAKGDGKTDDTQALTHAVARSDGQMVLPRGDYRITRPLIVPLEKHGRCSITGEGGQARLIMSGAGPAFHLVGAHEGTAAPESVEPKVWLKQRMPTINGLEIVGDHPKADGIRLEGVMQPLLSGLLIRKVRHGIHLVKRNRNVDISDCHIYDNSGVGIFLDGVNLHQINIHGNHVSYCKQGGIKIATSETRNIQVSANDIEYNYDLKAPTSADVLFDAREGSIREGTIVGCTIQAKKSPGGANVRLIGNEKHPNAVGLLTISGNLIGSQETAMDLQACRGVVVSGNCIYSGYDHALRADRCEHLVLNGNSFDHNPDYKGMSTDQIRFSHCRYVNAQGMLLQATLSSGRKIEATWEIEQCQGINITGAQIIDARKRGIRIQQSSDVQISGCSIQRKEGDRAFHSSILVGNQCKRVSVQNCSVSKGTEGDVVMPKGAGVRSGCAGI